MEITYTWKVTELQVLLDMNSMQNVVNYVEFVVVAEKNGITINSRDWNTYLPQPETGTDFIVFENLTNDIVIDWCKKILGDSFVKGVEFRLNERIDLILAGQDPIKKQLPWQ